MPLDLQTALRLTVSNNLDIAIAQQVVAQAEAALERARVLMVPTANLGSTYLNHQGQIQQAVGNILTTNRQSLFVGGGPSLTVSFGDALFQPLAARQNLNAVQAGQVRITNDSLLAVAEAYFAILRARRRLAALNETLEHLESDQRSPIRGDSKGLVVLVRDFVEVGGKDALRSDLERVRVEIFRWKQLVAVAVQDLRVAMAELARLLYLDPETPLWPVEDFRLPVPVPGEPWADRDVEELVRFALENRPEVAENRAYVQAALERLRGARVRPFVPNLTLNYSAGGFGGSPNFVTRVPGKGLGVGPDMTGGDRIDYFDGRNDFEAGLYWRLNNLGFGNQAEIREQRALRDQAQLRLLSWQNRIMAQVVSAQEQVVRSRERVHITRTSLFGPNMELSGPVFTSVRLNFERVRGAEGRPLEVLDSIRRVFDLLDDYGLALTDYERARFRLIVALGMPPRTIVEPASMPLPPTAPCPSSP
jgi:outer membrane protein TolC